MYVPLRTVLNNTMQSEVWTGLLLVLSISLIGVILPSWYGSEALKWYQKAACVWDTSSSNKTNIVR